MPYGRRSNNLILSYNPQWMINMAVNSLVFYWLMGEVRLLIISFMFLNKYKNKRRLGRGHMVTSTWYRMRRDSCWLWSWSRWKWLRMSPIFESIWMGKSSAWRPWIHKILLSCTMLLKTSRASILFWSIAMGEISSTIKLNLRTGYSPFKKQPKCLLRSLLGSNSSINKATCIVISSLRMS